jgi:peptide-methionine (S)-S-oxide reductase
MRQKPAIGLLFILILVVGGAYFLLSQGRSEESPEAQSREAEGTTSAEAAMEDNAMTEKATLGGGCFWCIEAVYERIEGVTSVVSGYAGGTMQDPDYKTVSSGKTGHAEVVQITYDPELISYKDILALFWKAHNPTTRNRQGADVGAQYRSIILYHNDEQKKAAEESLSEAQKSYSNKIVTEVKPLTEFFTAEDYHQDYYEKNPYAGYCQAVIDPKLKKLGLE